MYMCKAAYKEHRKNDLSHQDSCFRLTTNIVWNIVFMCMCILLALLIWENIVVGMQHGWHSIHKAQADSDNGGLWHERRPWKGENKVVSLLTSVQNNGHACVENASTGRPASIYSDQLLFLYVTACFRKAIFLIV